MISSYFCWCSLQVRECRLVGLIDMDHHNDHVIDKQAEYLNKLIRYGVAGFRLDAAKHMYPEDLERLYPHIDDLNTDWFPAGSKPMMLLEVIDQSQHNEVSAAWYTHLGRVTEFRYCQKIAQVGGLQFY